MKRAMRVAWKRDIRERKRRKTKGTDMGSMLAREKWQILTIRVLEMVFEERCRQIEKHGEAMRALPDGTGPDVTWIPALRPGLQPGPGQPTPLATAKEIQVLFREEYDRLRGDAEEPSKRLTRMHLVREELAEAFELDGDDPEFVGEILQVAALCVQWAEYKLEAQDLI